MGTVSITASGFAALPAQAPANWPAGVVWPGGGNPNGTKTSAAISDADWIQILTWCAASQVTPNAGTLGAPTTVTAGQILVAWITNWWQGTKQAVQQYFTSPPVPPSQIGLN